MTDQSTLDDAKNTILQASTAPIILQSYTGSPTDLSYLKQYVLSAVENLYGVAASVFDHATIYSTTLLRDFLHRALLDNESTVTNEPSPIAPLYDDVAGALRYPLDALCGLTSFQLLQIYRAFGYQAEYVDTVDGELGLRTSAAGQTNPYSYGEGHVTTEVYLEDYGGYGIQDAYFNMIPTDSNGTPLDVLTLRKDIYEDHLSPDFQVFDSYVYSGPSGSPASSFSQFDSGTQWFFENDYPLLPYAWTTSDLDGYQSINSIVANWNTFHFDPQGPSFATAADADAAIAPYLQAGDDWQTTLDDLRTSYYATGFRLMNEQGTIDGEWVTLSLNDGSFVSIELGSGEALNGSLDQLVLEATGTGQSLNGPAVDLSSFFDSVELFTVSGTIIADPWSQRLEKAPVVDNPVSNQSATAGQGWSFTVPSDTFSDQNGESLQFGSTLQNGSPLPSWLHFDVASHTFDGTPPGNAPRTLDLQVTANDGFSTASDDFLLTTANTTADPVPSDFNADAMSDILWQNDGGDVAIWEMNGTNVGYAPILANNLGPTWHAIGTGDFNGDGVADILWQNTSGAVAIWEMYGPSVMNSTTLSVNPGPTWHAIGTGDFNGDGFADILWQNDNGAVSIWEMNGTNIGYDPILHVNPGPSWHVIGAGDFNDDGKSDILWQNDNGAVAIWEMNGTNIGYNPILPVNPGPTSHVIDAGDFNGDGMSDILWQNDSGAASIWEMNGTNITTQAAVGNPGASFHAINTADYNGDGKADITWQNDNGAASIWEMDGATILTQAMLSPNPGSSWHVIGPNHGLVT